MANIIAIVWDFDKTLVDGYMQDPIFEDYQVAPKDFWAEVNSLPKKYKEQQGVKVNRDLIYLNQFIIIHIIHYLPIYEMFVRFVGIVILFIQNLLNI